MKKYMVMSMALVVAILLMAPVQAAARVVLVSTPIPGGDGGAICACVNVTKKAQFTVNFIRKAPGMTLTTWSIIILPGGIAETATSTSFSTYCQIERSDGLAITKKQLLCTMSAIDANGNPTLSVPVNITRKVPNW